MAELVKQRLAVYRVFRLPCWSGGVNPVLLIPGRGAKTSVAVRYYWVNDRLGGSAFAVGQQRRVVDEVKAAVGDLRRGCDVFGVTVETARHHTSVLNHHGLTAVGAACAA